MVFTVIGWTIIHSLWQCLGLVAGLKLFLGFVDVRRSGVRYAAALGVLGLAVVSVLATFVWEWRAMGGSVAPAVAGGGGVAEIGTGVVMAAPGAGADLAWQVWLARCCPYLTVGWMVGVVFYSGRLLLSGFELGRMRRIEEAEASGRMSPSSEGVRGLLDLVQRRMGVRRYVQLLVTERAAEPMTFGFLKAVVVLPLQYASQIPTDQLEMILAHEVAHILRRDYLVNLVQSVFDALLFFNPCFRMISAIVREEREYCCDDLAAAAVGGEERMAVALTNLRLVRSGLALGLSVTPSKGSFYRRVTRLIEPVKRPGFSVRAALFGLLGAFVVVVVLSQCSRSVIARYTMPTASDRIGTVLEDNQAGYKEVVYNYTRGGQVHDIFMVKTQKEATPLYGYLDGVRLDQERMDIIVKMLKSQREVNVVYVRGRRDAELKEDEPMAKIVPDSLGSIEKEIKVRAAEGKDTAELVKIRVRFIKEQVESAMSEYKQEVRNIPFGVEQHELLTRIITNNAYSPEDRRQLNELIRKRGLDEVRVEGKVIKD